MTDKELVVVHSPDVVALASEWEPLVGEARALVVNSKESHAQAINGYRLLKIASKRITEHYEPTRAALEKAKKELLRARDGLLAPIDEAIKIVSGKASAYEIEETRRANEAARLAEEAERRRLEDEKLAQAESLEKAGASSLADMVIEKPVEVAPVKAAPEVSTVAGVSARITYHAEVFDALALARYAGQCPEKGLVLPNMPILNSLAREHKEALAIPGVRAVAETVRTVRG